MKTLDDALSDIADRVVILNEPTVAIVCIGPPECNMQVDTVCSYCERFDIAADGTIKRQCDA